MDLRGGDPHERNGGHLADHRQDRLTGIPVDDAAQQGELTEERVVHADRADRSDLRRDRAGGLVVRPRRVEFADQRGAGRAQPVQVPPCQAVPLVRGQLLDNAELVIDGGEVSGLERDIHQPDVAP
jgi:hypothetical protein